MVRAARGRVSRVLQGPGLGFKKEPAKAATSRTDGVGAARMPGVDVAGQASCLPRSHLTSIPSRPQGDGPTLGSPKGAVIPCAPGFSVPQADPHPQQRSAIAAPRLLPPSWAPPAPNPLPSQQLPGAPEWGSQGISSHCSTRHRNPGAASLHKTPARPLAPQAQGQASPCRGPLTPHPRAGGRRGRCRSPARRRRRRRRRC